MQISSLKTWDRKLRLQVEIALRWQISIRKSPDFSGENDSIYLKNEFRLGLDITICNIK